MSETKVSGRDEIILISMDNGSTYQPVACLTNNEFNIDGSAIDTSSKCGDEFLPPVKISAKLTGEGFTILQYGTSPKFSTAEILAAFQAKTVFLWKKSKATPVTGDNVLSGDGFFTSLVITDKDGEEETFKCEIMVKSPDSVALSPAY